MTDFTLPSGYKAWCHVCVDKTTEVDGKQLPGVGFKGENAIQEIQEHELKEHRVWKG